MKSILNMINVLVFPCGSEIAIEIYNCLHQQKNIQLFGASSVSDNGRFVFENYIGDIPYVADPLFIPTISAVVEKYNIDYIYPAMDVAITALKNSQDQLGCHVLSSPKDTVNILSRKSTTYNYFENIIRVPKIITGPVTEFPVFSKPDIGASSRNTLLVDNDLALQYARSKYPDNLLLEYLPGPEYTVDCFNDSHGTLKFVSARQRSRIMNGISVGTELVKDPEIDTIADLISNNLLLTGPWFFQLKKDRDDKYCLLEIADRFGGSSVLNRLHGVNFALLNIYKEYGNVSVLTNDYAIEIGRGLDIKVKTNLDYQTVYIDFDDTVVVNNQVNTQCLEFLYRCVNKKCRIVLLTKHRGDIYQTLSHYKINHLLFDEIIQIDPMDHKYKYIQDFRSIFIDDSFSERQAVHTKCKIPVIGIENIKFI